MFNHLKSFIDREQITLAKLISPSFVIRLLIRLKYFHFFLTGVTGIGIGLGITWVLTDFVFGRQYYFTAYLIGIAANLVYNFTLHTIVTFQTTERHAKRFITFIVYSLTMAALQAYLVKQTVPIVGVEFYLVVIATIVLVFSTVSFLVFKLSLFNEKKDEHTTIS